MNTKLLLLVILVQSFLSLIIFGQAPNSFSYQAVLRDASGNLQTNTDVTMEISILHDSATGPAVYTETHDTTTNDFGLVNLQIGGGTVVSGNIANINWADGPYFLKITVDGIDFGTSQLLSVPYSKYATTAGTANSLSLANKTHRYNFHPNGYMPYTNSVNYLTFSEGPYYDQIYATTAGDRDIQIPLDIPSQVLGSSQKVKSITFTYQCSDANNYISNIMVWKYSLAGGQASMGGGAVALTSTDEASYTINVPSYQQDFTDMCIVMLLRLHFSDTGSAHDITLFNVVVEVE